MATEFLPSSLGRIEGPEAPGDWCIGQDYSFRVDWNRTGDLAVLNPSVLHMSVFPKSSASVYLDAY